MQYDVIIVGGSYAGLSAALPLARARRRVLVVDDGQRRNRFATHAHGLLTQDGRDPAAIAADGRQQLMRYPTVTWRDGRVVSARAVVDGFVIKLSGQPEQTTRRLVLATGVQDRLPDLPGLADRWGRSVFHCPYCHGYELQQGPIGVIATSALAMHQAALLPDWGPTTLFLNDALQPDADQQALLARRGVQVVEGPVKAIEDQATGVLASGTRHVLQGLFVGAMIDLPGELIDGLGCARDDSPLGATVRVGPTKATSVPGVFACGDLARPGGSVPLAVGDGAIAGAAAHQSLVFGLRP